MVSRPLTFSRLPVIVTNWSGPSDFLTSDNSYPLPINGTEISSFSTSENWAKVQIFLFLLLIAHNIAFIEPFEEVNETCV